ncbi:MAG: helix-turn-helix transcriptional regulator [Flavobacteriales bacterium]
MQALLQKYGYTVGLVPEPPAPEVVPVKLSKRMREYMGLMCQGLTIKEIGHIMNVCPSTLRIWRNRIFERYGIRGRVLLALWARENGLG